MAPPRHLRSATRLVRLGLPDSCIAPVLAEEFRMTHEEALETIALAREAIQTWSSLTEPADLAS